MNSFFKFLFLNFLFGLFFTDLLYCDMRGDVEEVIKLYNSDKSNSIFLLNKLYKEQRNSLFEIKKILFENQKYALYCDFLRQLQLRPEIAQEIIYMDFTTDDYKYFISDLSNYLKFFPLRSIPERFSSYIIEKNFVNYALSNLDSHMIFDILKSGFAKNSKYREFDEVLLKNPSRNNISEDDIKRYLIESWRIDRRNLKPIIEFYNLTNSWTFIFSVASDFQLDNLGAILELTNRAIEIIGKEEKIARECRIDVPYIIGESLLRMNIYSQARFYLEKSFFPSENHANRSIFFTYLGENNIDSARQRLKSMEEGDDIVFLSSLIQLLLKNTNAIEDIETYLLTIPGRRKYNLEAMLILFSYNEKEDFQNTLNVIRESLAYKKNWKTAEGLKGVYLTRKEDFSVQNSQEKGHLEDFHNYKKAVSAMKNDKETSRRILLELIQSPKTSPLIKNLSVYEYRRLEK